jgi:hypothetical protein
VGGVYDPVDGCWGARFIVKELVEAFIAYRHAEHFNVEVLQI